MDNFVLQTIENRVSLRVYDDREISREILDKILHAAMRAPTAGNQMLYSIIVIKDPETKELLSQSCDHQPFIKTAPVLLLFVADQQKWFDYYSLNHVGEYCRREGLCFEAPQESDLFLAIEDTMAAAQNAVIAAESLGVGSCYIGDILERTEFHQKLFQLPQWTFPVALLCLGYYREGKKPKPRPRFEQQYVVFEEKYHRLSEEEYRKMFEQREKTFRSEQNPYHADCFAQAFYARKTGAKFSKEMARSVRVGLKQWDGRILNPDNNYEK